VPLPDLQDKPSRVIKELYSKEPRRTPVPRELSTLINTTRSSNYEAYLMQAVGDSRDNAYRNYKKDNGPWEGCITLDGFFGDSCANCYFNSIDQRCSFCTYLTLRAFSGPFGGHS
jgi:hypothetical protein